MRSPATRSVSTSRRLGERGDVQVVAGRTSARAGAGQRPTGSRRIPPLPPRPPSPRSTTSAAERRRAAERAQARAAHGRTRRARRRGSRQSRRRPTIAPPLLAPSRATVGVMVAARSLRVKRHEQAARGRRTHPRTRSSPALCARYAVPRSLRPPMRSVSTWARSQRAGTSPSRSATCFDPRPKRTTLLRSRSRPSAPLVNVRCSSP